MPTVSENEKKTLGNTTLKVQQTTGIIEQKKHLSSHHPLVPYPSTHVASRLLVVGNEDMYMDINTHMSTSYAYLLPSLPLRDEQPPYADNQTDTCADAQRSS